MNKQVKEIQEAFEKEGFELPKENLISEPETSSEHLLALEKKYGINTNEIVSNPSTYNDKLGKIVVDEWVKYYHRFKFFNGNDNDLNKEE